MLQQPLISIIKNKQNQEIYSISSTTSVAEAVQLLNRHNIGSLPVMDGGRLMGIFTERDVLRRVVESNLDPRSTPVSQVMTREVFCIKPSTTVEEALNIMTKKRYRHLPVVENNQLLGIVSMGDLTHWIIKDQQDQVDRLIYATEATWTWA